jgi:ABC-2 type transport system permease protein
VNIFWRELRATRKSLIIWSVIVILFAVVGTNKFSAFYKNPDLLAMMDAMPPAMVTALNMDAFNLTTLNGFYGVMITYNALILSIAAAMWGSDIISKEERDRTVEFSLTLPVTRARLITGKAAATAFNSLVLLAVAFGITVVTAQPYAPDGTFYRFVAISMLAYALLMAIFLTLGILLGCAMRQYKRAGTAAVWILLAAYFGSLLVELNAGVRWLRYVTPFSYYYPLLMLHESRLEVPFVALAVVIAAACLAGAYATYEKRDLYI